jgi:hypothetical protein
MPLCISTGLTIRNTFLDVDPDDHTGVSPKGSKSCVARFAETSPHFPLKDSVEGSTDADSTPDCSDAEDDGSDTWVEGDNIVNVVRNDVGQFGAQWGDTFSTHWPISNAGTDVFGSSVLPCMNTVGDDVVQLDAHLGHAFSTQWPVTHGGTDIFVSPVLSLPTVSMQPVMQPFVQVCVGNDVPAASLLSKGSQYHGTTTVDGLPACQPCAWYHKAAGCKNGADCSYCHVCPADEMKKRRKEKIARFHAQS